MQKSIVVLKQKSLMKHKNFKSKIGSQKVGHSLITFAIKMALWTVQPSLLLRMAMQKSIPGLKCISMQYTDFATYNEKLAKYTFVDKIRGLTKNYGQEQKEALLKSHAVENHKDESILNELNRMLKQAKDEGMSMYEYITGAASATPIENLETLALKVKNMSPSMVMEGISNYGAQSEPLRLRRRTEVVVKQRDPAVDASNVSIRKLK